ncbi:MAG: hypothetical protein ACFE9L_12135 [Candidatus Hodarchaeota archaeon]
MIVPLKDLFDQTSPVKAYRLKDPQLSERCLLIESPSARRILTNHFLVGAQLVSQCRAAVKDYLSVFFSLQAWKLKFTQMVEVVPLSGSLTYDVLTAFYELQQHTLARIFIGIRRFQKPDGIWDTEVSYTNFESLSDNIKMVFIGDTIATRVTITKVIRMIQAHVQVPLAVIVISIAGSLIGARRLVQLEKSTQKSFPGTEIWCLFTEAFLGLEDNGTDMPVLHPDTISVPELNQVAKQQLGEYLARNLCSVLDWGKRTNAPLEHYQDLLSTLQRLKINSVKNSNIDRLINECQRMLSAEKFK